MDVRYLYPSLALDDILETVMEIVEDTKLTLEDVDTKHLATYLAVMVSKEELAKRGLTEGLKKDVFLSTFCG